MASESTVNEELYAFSDNPIEVIEQILERLPNLEDTNETFAFFIGNMFKQILVGKKDVIDGKDSKGLLVATECPIFQTQQMNAVAKKLLGCLLGHTACMSTEGNKDKEIDILEKDKPVKLRIATSPKTPVIFMSLNWGGQISIMLDKIDEYVDKVTEMNGDSDESYVYSEMQRRLADLLMYYSDREGRAALEQCARLMAMHPGDSKTRAYLECKIGYRFLKGLKEEIEKIPEGGGRIDYFIRQMTMDPGHLSVLLDYLITEDVDYDFWMDLLQQSCQRHALPDVFRDIPYGFLPHELMYLVNKPHIFGKAGLQYIIDGIAELREASDYVIAGQPIVAC